MPNFVEENCSTVALVKIFPGRWSTAVATRFPIPNNSASISSEGTALQLYGIKGALRAMAQFVDGTRNQFLPRSTFTVDEDIGIG